VRITHGARQQRCARWRGGAGWLLNEPSAGPGYWVGNDVPVVAVSYSMHPVWLVVTRHEHTGGCSSMPSGSGLGCMQQYRMACIECQHKAGGFRAQSTEGGGTCAPCYFRARSYQLDDDSRHREGGPSHHRVAMMRWGGPHMTAHGWLLVSCDKHVSLCILFLVAAQHSLQGIPPTQLFDV
jgi:hypothetical protein